MQEDPNKEVEEELEQGGKRIEIETEYVLGTCIALLLFMAWLLNSCN